MKKLTFAFPFISTLMLALASSEAVETTSEKLSGLAVNAGISGSAAPDDWKAWAQWIEKLRPVTDNQGHGPDIGSHEWAGALDKKLDIGGAVGSKEWHKAVEMKMIAKEKPAAETKRELLSTHDTEASFVGLKDHRCMGLTSLCPDQCGESGKLATFQIIQYLNYKKPGEYGDPKQEQFMVLIEDNMKNPKVPAAIRDAILSLKPGALVHLKWNHDYVTREGTSFPERPIIDLIPIQETPPK